MPQRPSLKAKDSLPRFLINCMQPGPTPNSWSSEITEHSLLNLEKSARADLLSLTDAGVGIYVDDFGTGYSSRDLARLPRVWPETRSRFCGSSGPGRDGPNESPRVRASSN